VWCWCIMKASYKERWVSVVAGKGKTEVRVGPGQFIFGRETAAKELRMKLGSVYDRMQKLKNMQNINIEPNNKYSIITICNWYTYQAEENDSQQQSQQLSNSYPTAIQHKQEGKEGKEEEIYVAPPARQQIPYSEIVSFLNSKAGTSFLPNTAATKRHIKARWAEGFRIEDFKAVIEKKCDEWKTDSEMCQYLRPQTLFGTKFESYLQNSGGPQQQQVTTWVTQ
jgi:uncharacterized phage protein (TIGR02220 family)